MAKKQTIYAVSGLNVLFHGLLLALASVAPSQVSSVVSWEAQPAPFRLSFRQGDRLLTSQSIGNAGPGSRLSYRLTNGTQHSLTQQISTESLPNGTAYTVATDEPNRTARIAVTQTPRGARVEWTFSNTTDIAQVFEALSASPSEHFLGTGSRAQFVDLQRKVAPLKVHFVSATLSAQCNETNLPMPFFFSNAGYGIYLDTPNIGRIAFPGATPTVDPAQCKPDADPAQLISASDRTQIAIKANQLAYEVYAGSPASIMGSFMAIAGGMKLPPIEQFALYKWRDQVEGAADILDDIAQMQSRNLPIGSVILDNPWEKKLDRPQPPDSPVCNGTLIFDPVGFPDPKALIDAVHAKGVRFILWVAPFVIAQRNVEQCPALNYGLRSLINPLTQYGGTPGKRDVDLTQTTALQIYQNKLRQVFQLGVDGAKGDRGDESDFEPLQLGGGAGATLHNSYPYLFAKAVTDVLQSTQGKNWTTLFRAGFTQSPTVLNGIWAGDQLASFEGLQQAIRRGLTSSVSGYPIWGSDVGGYVGSDTTPTPEVFIRWMQLGAISPILEVGGTGRQAKFWEYGDTVVEQFRKFATLHYELFPYHYQLAGQAASTGVPILRPLGFQYPQDETAWQQALALMVGPSILAAPITTASPDASGTVTAQVYLPTGGWVDFYNGRILNGPILDQRSTALDEFPLYIQQGAIIPFHLRSPDVWANAWGVNDLNRRDRSGWLYAPKPGNTLTQSSVFGGSIQVKQQGQTIDLQLTQAPPEMQVYVLTARKPETVSIAGTMIPESTDLQLLKAAEVGWTYKAKSGVILKLKPISSRTTTSLRLPSD